MVGKILQISILLINMGIIQLNNSMYLRSVGVMAAASYETSDNEPTRSSTGEAMMDVDDMNIQIINVIFKRDDSERNIEQKTVMDKNPMFYFQSEKRPLGGLCNGSHEKIHQVADSVENPVTDFQSKFKCSQGNPMKYHTLVESYQFIITKTKSDLKFNFTGHFFYKSCMCFEKLLSLKKNDSLFDVSLDSFTEIMKLLEYLITKPTLISNEEPMECDQAEGKNILLEKNDGSKEIPQDLSYSEFAEIVEETLISKGYYEWPLAAYLSIFNLSLQYCNDVLIIQKQANQIFSFDLADKTIGKNFYVRIIKGSFFSLDQACTFQENIDILSFFFKNKNILGLELIDFEHEPMADEKYMRHDAEIIRKPENELQEEINTRGALLKLMNIPAFREIKTLKIKNVDLHGIDVNILFELKNLINLEVTSESEEIKRGIGKIIRENNNLKSILLESVLLSEILFYSLSTVSPEVFVLKNCKPYERNRNTNSETISFHSLFEDSKSKFGSKLLQLEIVGGKNLNPNFFAHLKNLKILKLISCLNENISEERFKNISEIKNLEELTISGNTFYQNFTLKIFSDITSLSKLELVDCEIDFSSYENTNLCAIKWNCDLKELSISTNHSVGVFKFINCFPTLEVLNLSEYDVKDIGYNTNQLSVELPPNLKVLKLEKLGKAFFRKFHITPLKKIESLSLRDSNLITCCDFLRTIDETSPLIKLDLSSCTLNIIDTRKLRIYKTVKHLFIYDTQFQNMNINEFLGELNGFALEEIYISNVDLIIKGVKLISQLNKFPSLKKIFLYSVSIPEKSFDSTELSGFPNLKLFSIGYDEKNVCKKEIEILESFFNSEILKTFKIDSPLILTNEKKQAPLASAPERVE
ncbi:hypothetical protein CWI36_1072p0010 [Hamiltosporidium magnivora]|uniref:Leucine-rich repeat-containing protein n=1 Tax=Hamiltosporidium magnivora TaxID=148818 RepID=A0A4Q9L4Z4_9MICR|nr:hypothetical protein CWI36_1072p0010 [Hamiltosporidium magnivora]